MKIVLFADELEQTLERLAANPEVGQNVYYVHDRENDLVEVHTIWGAHKERGPGL